MAEDWKEYQEEAAEFFRGMGLDAQTNETLQGARSQHDIDVVVRSQHIGFEILWIVECKHWKTKVSKLHVMALRQIVADIGADRGILLCEVGFQSGAVEAANLTNVRTSSLAEFQIASRDQINLMRIRELFDRVDTCWAQYWNIPRDDRIALGLRPDRCGYGYNAATFLSHAVDLLGKALRETYPIKCDEDAAMIYGFPSEIASGEECFQLFDPLMSELQVKIEGYQKRQTLTESVNVTFKDA